MKARSPSLLPVLGCLMLAFSNSSAHGVEARVFTDKTGRTIKAELISVTQGVATLKKADGQTFSLNVDTFSDADARFLKEQENPPTAAGPTAVPKGAVVNLDKTAPLPNAVVIEALIDGPSELRVKKDGIYWINGTNAKPGRHEGHEEPTYVDGKSWRPNWKEARQDRGVDRTATKSVDGIDPDKVEFKLLSISSQRDGTGIEKRDPVQVSKIKDELSINIPDSQGGSRWYRFALVKKE